MKKNFFKKLSFVMALAMIVTALAPAAGVFAAAAPKLNAKTVYLHVAEKTTEFDFNVANKKTGWKYSWKSSNADVAEVASNGLTTAVGVGTATVSVVIKDKNGEKVDTLKAKVVVRDNIKKLTITNTPAGGKLAVGAKNDFNRSYVTASGSKTKTSGITRWEVDKTGATVVATSGLFTATEAGTYKVTARAFQSTDKYNSWLADKTKYASYVTATAETTVTVAPTMVKVEQTDLDSFKVTFDSAVADAATKLSVAQVIGTTEVVQGIKKVTMSADNKVATVDMNTEFAQEFVYKVKYPELTDVQFTAAKVDAALVTSIEVTTKTVQDGRGTNVDVALYNKDMVNIATDTLLQRITLETSATNSSVAGRQLFLYTKGTTTTVKATYHTYTYDTTGKETGTLTASGVVTCVAWADYTLDSISAYSVKNVAPDWVTVNHNIAVGDTGLKLWVKLKGVKFDGTGVEYVNTDAAIAAGVKFVSSNINVLLVNESTGDLTPVTTGTASILVKYNDNTVGAVAVTVVAKRAVASASLSASQLTLSNTFADPQTINLTVKDQFGDKMDPSKYTVSVGESTSTSMETWHVGTSTSAQGNLTLDPTLEATTGTYTFTVKVKDNTTQAEVPTYLTVILQHPTVTLSGATSYKIEVGKSQYDTKLDPGAGDITEDATFTVYGYADGMKVGIVPIATVSGGGAKYVKFEKDGASKVGDNVFTNNTTSATYSLVNSAIVTGSATAITKAATGTYTIALVDSTNGRVLASNYFTVVDTQAKPTWKLVNSLVDIATVSDIDTAVDEAFDVTLNGVNVESSIGTIEYVSAGTNNQYLIQKIHVKEMLGNGNSAWIDHVLDVNVTITTK